MYKIKKYLFFASGMALLWLIIASFFACSQKTDEETLKLYVRASAFFNEGKFNEVLTLLLDSNSAKSVENFVPALVLRGKARYFLDKNGEAEADFKAALKKNPANADAALYLARVMRETGRPEDALAIAEGLLANDPNDVRTLRFASELLKDSESGGAASLAYLDRAASAGIESAFVLLERARRRWAAGRAEEALEDLAGARAISGKDGSLSRVINNLEKTIKEGAKNE